MDDCPTTVVFSPTNPAPSATWPVLPGYEILATLGQGGMGVVYKARQISLKRIVALKMMRDAAADPAALARFRSEAESIARLRHPNIVQIYEIGEHHGRPFFSLELVEGTNLAQMLAGSLPSFRETAFLVATLAQAIHAAHQNGIIHRDLKPGNILLSRDGRPSRSDNEDALGKRVGAGPITFVPKITDFGLAKRLDSKADLTRSGDVLGTPTYMAPEQATGEIICIGPATDIYSLGVILYELITGQPPFRGQSASAVLWQVVHEAPVPPGRLRARVPRDLETICLTCLNKDPRARYGSADQLAEDLHAYLAGLPIKASPPSRRQRLAGWFRGHPAIALLLGIGTMAAAGLLVGLWFQNALAVGALAVISLCLGAWWYNARLQRALAEVRQQNLFSQRSVEQLNHLMETINRLLATPNLVERLHILSEATSRLVNAERATIYLIDEARGEIWSRVALGTDMSVIRIPLGTGIAGAVAQTGEIINLPDAYRDPRFNPDIDRRSGFTTRNMLTLPMSDPGGRRLGVFQVLNKRGGPFGAEDVEILFHLAKSAALVVGSEDVA